jgi:DNA-directed RNA polymerase subunit RPC12/RpoP
MSDDTKHKCARCGWPEIESTGYEAFKAGTFRFYVCGRCGDKDYDILDELHGQLGLFDTPAQHGPDQLIMPDGPEAE